MRLEEVLDIDIGESSASQAGGKLVPNDFRSLGRNAEDDFENDVVQRLSPAIRPQDVPGGRPHGALRRSLAERP